MQIVHEESALEGTMSKNLKPTTKKKKKKKDVVCGRAGVSGGSCVRQVFKVDEREVGGATAGGGGGGTCE